MSAYEKAVEVPGFLDLSIWHQSDLVWGFLKEEQDKRPKANIEPYTGPVFMSEAKRWWLYGRPWIVFEGG